MSEGATKSAPPTLDYARDPRRQRIRRRIIRAVAALAIALPIYLSRGLIWFRVEQAYWFQRCMNHVTPPGTVLSEWSEKNNPLFQTNPQYVDALTYIPRVPPGATPRVLGSGWSSGTFSIYVPVELREFEKYVYVGNPQVATDEAVFIGARKTPSGKSRLVIIRSGHGPPEMLPGGIRAYVCAPPDLLHGVAAPTVTARPYKSSNFMDGAIRLFFFAPGVADPSDQTHITIPIISGASGTIDAYLQNDDTLSYSMRK